MRSNGLASFLLLIPMLAVPALAIFGIPQFAPVVASPLDEGRDFDRERRIGNSARPAQDDLFADLESFDHEGSRNGFPEGNDESDRLLARSPRTRQKTKPSSWGDDVETDSSWSDAPVAKSVPERGRKRVAAVEVRNPIEDSDQPFPKSSSRRRSADSPSMSRRSNRDEKIQLASASETEFSVQQSAYQAEEPQADAVTRRTPPAGRPRRLESEAMVRDTDASEPLSWKEAVERLNALEIRNFRLEPGSQSGQYIFICSYTPPNAPRVSYRFEAAADEPLKAVEKVLQQVKEWQQRR